MPEPTGRPSSRLEPAPAWTVLTDSPLKGLALAREAATILAWDEGDQVYLLDTRGEHRSVSRAPDKIVAATISDCGTLVALLVERSRLLLLSADLETIADRSAPPDAQAVAVDPHGRYVVVASRINVNQFYTRFGKPAGKFATRQPLAHLSFVPDRAFLLGAAAFGSLIGVELRGGAGSGRLGAEVVWDEALLSNVGRLTTSGDGGLILASCYAHGVQRYDLRGRNEGAYHLGGTAAHAVSDFPGRLIAVATLEGELVILSPGGQVRWRKGLPRPAKALEADPLGRFLIYGQATGEIVRLDLERSGREAGAGGPAAVGAPASAGSRSLRKPDWTREVVPSDDQAETAVLAVLDDPPRIGLLARSNRLQVFTTEGKNLGSASELLGIGRLLRTAPGWIASATDRQIALYDARRNAALKIDVSLAELTHLALRPDSFGMALVQERDRAGRLTPAGRWIWKKELPSAVEDLAIGPDGYSALSLDNGRLEIYHPTGALAGSYTADPTEPLCMIEAPESSPAPTVWISLARRAQVLRGHDLEGSVLWETQLEWEGWQLQRVGPLAVVSAPDGRALACDGAGTIRAVSRATGGGAELFGVSPDGEPWRVTRQEVHLICADLAGRVLWRAVADQALGPFAVGQSGVAALIGKRLAWFRGDG
jgi:hypothetical protein